MNVDTSDTPIIPPLTTQQAPFQPHVQPVPQATPDIAAMFQEMQKQLTNISAGLITVTNEVAYLKAKDDDSDYGEDVAPLGDGELEDLANDAYPEGFATNAPLQRKTTRSGKKY